MVRKYQSPLAMIQTPHEFFQELIRTFSAAKKGDVLWLQSMLFEGGEYIEAVVFALVKAKKAGAEITLLIDSFGLLTAQDLPVKSLFFNLDKEKAISKDIKKKHELLRMLRNIGVTVAIGGSVNRLKSQFPWFFCNHRKSYGIINENSGRYLAWVTGVNLTQASFHYFDIAARIDRRDLVKIIYGQFLCDLSQQNLKKNRAYSFNRTVKYLITNNSNHSNIRDAAYKLIKNASVFIRFVSQYPVDPFLLNSMLKKAQQGVRIEILTSSHDDAFNSHKLFGLFNMYFNHLIARFSNISRGYFPGKVHAKLLFSEKEALIGSDNMSVVTNFLQTKENMLLISDNPGCIFQLDQFFTVGWKKADIQNRIKDKSEAVVL